MARTGTPALTMHELLLALAGRVDDDLLAQSRELVAIGEDTQALELLAATLVADRTALPSQVRETVVALGQSLRIGLDAERELVPARREGGTTHRFDADAGGPAAAARIGTVLAGAAHRPPGCRTWLTWRITPAGSAPGPLPYPVILVEIAAEAAFEEHLADVMAYRFAATLDRAGTAASVEVFVAGTALPSYHAAALKSARPVPDASPPAPRRPAAHVRPRSTPPPPTPGRAPSVDGVPPRPVPPQHPAPRLAADPSAVDVPTVGLRLGPAGPPAGGGYVQGPPAALPPAPNAHPAAERSDADVAPVQEPPVEAEADDEGDGMAAASPGGRPDPLNGPLRQPLLDPLLDPTSAIPEPQASPRPPAPLKPPAAPRPSAATEPPQQPWADEWASGEWAMPAPSVPAEDSGTAAPTDEVATDAAEEQGAIDQPDTGRAAGPSARLTDAAPGAEQQDPAEPDLFEPDLFEPESTQPDRDPSDLGQPDPGRSGPPRPESTRPDHPQPMTGPAAPRPVRRRAPHQATGEPPAPEGGRRRARHRSDPDPEEQRGAGAPPPAAGGGDPTESAADPTLTLSDTERDLLSQLRAELAARERAPRHADPVNEHSNGFTPPHPIGPPELNN
ncbi:hypothetical protein [Pseudonocardia asaccharolytica]|uniref:Uncharacterized protein n=1 Tax=Pseudonocardia asaccharolytica DSM 44247 = NBRC 16224 TaxID=1123024 RepID=A0A511D0U4_9PSEU|nr:hypothetical protein [Pseudonocardia asaccharolytica]GEL18425.1 hypothetical protein PA7_22620 [Pseudonocardia asaccharolytica DSM 44247 = NBRC 16224]